MTRSATKGQPLTLMLLDLSECDDSVVARARDCLNPQEKQDNQTLQDSQMRKRHALSRGVLRHLLSQRIPQSPQQIALTTNANGKPALAAHDHRLFFNVSHSGDYLAIALSEIAELGVDIEATNTPRAFTRLAKRYFAPDEIAMLDTLDDDERRERFYTYWTLKEAYLKARGLGVFHGLDRCSFEPGLSQNPERPTLIVDAEDPLATHNWQCFTTSAPKDHRLSLVAHDCPDPHLPETWGTLPTDLSLFL